jgi:hypothetical protein
VFCTRSSIDQASNNVSLFEVVEEIAGVVVEMPPPGYAMPFQGQLVSLWTREVDQGVHGLARVLWEPPAREPMPLGGESDLDLTAFERLRTVNQIVGLPVFGNGRYHLIQQCRQDESPDWRTVARIPVTITVTMAPN